MPLTKQIPNFITLLNLLCGCIATLFAVKGDFITASIFVCLGIFFDFFDGLAARLLKAQSPLGLQLDSLADLVTSGVVPGVFMYQLLKQSMSTGWQEYSVCNGFYIEKECLLPMFGFLITLGSAYRLAKFNIDEDQQTYFKGLPVPANTLMIIALPLIVEFQDNEIANSLLSNTWFLIGLTILSCYLLNSKIKLIALKFKTWDIKPNIWRYGLVLTSAILLVLLKFIAIPLIILVYVIFSLFHFNTNK